MFTPGHFAARHFLASHFPGGGGGGVIIAAIEKTQLFIANMGRMMGRG